MHRTCSKPSKRPTRIPHRRPKPPWSKPNSVPTACTRWKKRIKRSDNIKSRNTPCNCVVPIWNTTRPRPINFPRPSSNWNETIAPHKPCTGRCKDPSIWTWNTTSARQVVHATLAHFDGHSSPVHCDIHPPATHHQLFLTSSHLFFFLHSRSPKNFLFFFSLADFRARNVRQEFASRLDAKESGYCRIAQGP
jgi:hypothetical protein